MKKIHFFSATFEVHFSVVKEQDQNSRTGWALSELGDTARPNGTGHSVKAILNRKLVFETRVLKMVCVCV